MNMNKFCVALIGGIGSGKSTVCDFFKNFNVEIISADKISRQLTQQDYVKKELKKLFGEKIFNDNDELNRKELRNIVFYNKNKKIQLEKLLHPLIRTGIINAINSKTTQYCIIELPVFKNKNEYPYIDKILCVQIDQAKQAKQAALRDNKSEEEINNIIKQQLSNKHQVTLADDVLNNNGNLEELELQCKQLHKKYLSLCSKVYKDN